MPPHRAPFEAPATATAATAVVGGAVLVDAAGMADRTLDTGATAGAVVVVVDTPAAAVGSSVAAVEAVSGAEVGREVAGGAVVARTWLVMGVAARLLRVLTGVARLAVCVCGGLVTALTDCM